MPSASFFTPPFVKRQSSHVSHYFWTVVFPKHGLAICLGSYPHRQNAATAPAIRPTADNNWYKFRESSSLRTNSSVRRNIPFSQGDRPTTKVAVWTCLVSDRDMAYPLRMGDESWMRFKNRIIYSTLPLPDDHSDNRLVGELSLSLHALTSGANVCFQSLPHRLRRPR